MKMINMKKIRIFVSMWIFAALVIIISTGCDPSKALEKEESQEIQDFLNLHPDIDYVKKNSGLYYYDDTVGTGPLAMTHDTAYIFYRGTYLDGNQFDTNLGTTDTLIRPVNEGWFIAGFDEAITYMRVGGKAKIIVPSFLGYFNYIPSHFDVYLVKLVPGPGDKGK
jgi:FKBP-type peptidyl-prolyl cis-trans isomerase